MGILYESTGLMGWAIGLCVLFSLIAFNQFGTGNWFNWVKTYSALAGCLGCRRALETN